ncbi:MAG: TIGR04283 family arsenosugar biosynthesis glycosyltransferase [Burkholderiales bacterium]
MIPVLNEAETIVNLLGSLQLLRSRGAEIVVIDGGSRDATLELARPLADRSITSLRGRARQMNTGAAAARGELLVFLHADVRLPEDADTLICAGLARANRDWGRFDISLSGTHPLLRMIEFAMNWRSRLTGIATGDQAMFMTRRLFDSVGGFPQLALMEDVAMSERLKARCRPLCLRTRVVASSRRWEDHGILRSMMLMWWLRLRFYFGADPRDLARIYYDNGG